jgi:DNA-binding NarL/FixJ family response regulator
MTVTSVLIVEDDPLTRSALAASFAAVGLQVAGAFATGEEAMRACSGVAADVAVVDLGLPGVSGVETIAALRRARPGLAVLVLTVVENPRQIIAAIEAGASGYLLKVTPMSEIVAAVGSVCDGLSPISPAVARHILATVRSGRVDEAGHPSSLSEREHEVVWLLVGGHSYQDIATALGIRLGTVQTHVKSIYRKLEVSSKAEAVSVALSGGIVDPPHRSPATRRK